MAIVAIFELHDRSSLLERSLGKRDHFLSLKPACSSTHLPGTRHHYHHTYVVVNARQQQQQQQQAGGGEEPFSLADHSSLMPCGPPSVSVACVCSVCVAAGRHMCSQPGLVASLLTFLLSFSILCLCTNVISHLCLSVCVYSPMSPVSLVPLSLIISCLLLTALTSLLCSHSFYSHSLLTCI